MAEPISDKGYNKILAEAQAQGDAKDYRHLDGWRSIKNAETIRLYVQGKVGLRLAIEHGAKPKDHLAALKAGHVTPEQLIEAGIDLQSLQRAEARQVRGLIREGQRLKASIAEAKANAPKTLAIIGGQVVKSGQVQHEPTVQELQVMIALMGADNRAKAKKAAEAKGKHGFEVPLTDAEKQAITNAHAPTPKVIK